MVKPIQKHIENISAFRKAIEKFENKDFDKLLSILGTPGIKQAVYNAPVNYADFIGSILKLIKN